MDEYITIDKIITSLIVAIPTAWLSVHFALKKYRTEKWWDTKLTCYLNTIDALNNLIVYCDCVIDIEFEEVNYTEDQIKLNESNYHEARSHLQAQVNLGGLLLSKVSHDAIVELNNELFTAERECNLGKRAADTREIAEYCVGVMVFNAKKDLGVK